MEFKRRPPGLRFLAFKGGKMRKTGHLEKAHFAEEKENFRKPTKTNKNQLKTDFISD